MPFDRFVGERASVDPDVFASPTDKQRTLTTDFLGVEQFPLEACFGFFEELAGPTETAEQRQPPLVCQ
ncbi:MAG: hypothetical protein J07HX64_01729 [halophilic archaeon J07HX64]|nr:MAG: hypothetical protein J07HX64_01729 [halophilic archaeon J07HX64]